MDQPKPDDIQYAMEVTRVLHEPARRIETFGTTKFEFLLLTELMDEVGKVRIRRGTVEADKPQLIKPAGFESYEFEGFGDRAQEYFDKIREAGLDPETLRMIRYGFQMKRSNTTETMVTDSLPNVADRIVAETVADGNPMMGVVVGVDDAWEFSVLRFMMQMMGKSQDINAFDFQRKGLL